MDLRQYIVKNMRVDDPEDMDFLLEFAQMLRDAIDKGDSQDAGELIRYTVVQSYYEAFRWAMGILEETWEHAGVSAVKFVCVLGNYIPDYSAFINSLQVDLNACGNDVAPIRDEHGEIQSFYNILTYQTCFSHIRLVTSENFDARDNDFIEYSLVCGN